MKLISEIPLDVLVSILKFWVNLTDIRDLDTAICNTEERIMFLDHLIYCGKTYSLCAKSISFTGRFVHWLYIKHLRINSIFFDENSIRCASEESLSVIMSSIHNIEILSTKDFNSVGNFREEFLLQLTTSLPQLKQVQFVDSNTVTDSFLEYLHQYCPKLTNIHIEGTCRFSGPLFNTFYLLWSFLPHLKTVSIIRGLGKFVSTSFTSKDTNLAVQTINFNDERVPHSFIMARLSSQFVNIHAIDFVDRLISGQRVPDSWNCNINELDIFEFSLERTIPKCTKLTKFAPSDDMPINQQIMLFNVCHETLTCLNLENCRDTLCDDDLNEIGMVCRNLLELSLRRCPRITETGILSIVRNNRQLSVLDCLRTGYNKVTNKSHLSVNAIHKIVSILPQLTKLDLTRSECTSRMMLTILEVCPLLRNLILRHCGINEYVMRRAQESHPNVIIKIYKWMTLLVSYSLCLVIILCKLSKSIIILN